MRVGSYRPPFRALRCDLARGLCMVCEAILIGDEVQRTIFYLVVNAAQVLPDNAEKDQLDAP